MAATRSHKEARLERREGPMSQPVVYIVGNLQFEWDLEKAESNFEKHKVSFAEGASVFKDLDALLLDDPDKFEDEVRFELLGYSAERRLLMVIHVERGMRLRIVSVRTASKPERRLYEETRKSGRWGDAGGV